MAQLTRNPKVAQLAKDLRLDWRRDPLAAIREHALTQVDQIIEDSPLPVDSLATLQWVVADKFRVKLEVVSDASDIARIADRFPDFDPLLRQRLAHEFTERTTEGITLERCEPDPRFFRYLAVVDGRGDRAPRVYFTSWHELAHFLVHPTQLAFPGFRRTPIAEEWVKDPIESVVDHVAGKIAFHPTLFQPVLDKAILDHGGLTFAAIDAAREAAAPTASLFATAMGCVNMCDHPAVLVVAEMALKADEKRASRSPQHTFAFGVTNIEEKLRATTLVANEAAVHSPLAIRRNMRVPPQSVLTRAYENVGDFTCRAIENQSLWESSRVGSLEPLQVSVEATRRGRYVYGLISLAT